MERDQENKVASHFGQSQCPLKLRLPRGNSQGGIKSRHIKQEAGQQIWRVESGTFERGAAGEYCPGPL